MHLYEDRGLTVSEDFSQKQELSISVNGYMSKKTAWCDVCTKWTAITNAAAMT